MRKLILLLTICTFTQNIWAQTDPKAKTVLDAVSKKVSSLKTLKANFALQLTGGKGNSVNESKKGNISIKGPKYHLEIAGQEIICDAKNVWTYNKEAKEVQISTFNADEQSMSPAKLLTNFYDKEYKYKYLSETKEGSKSVHVLELTPTDAKKQVIKIELKIDKSTNMIIGGAIWSKNGTKTTYAISNVVENGNIPDNYFSWDAKSHAGVEVLDMR
jgi:outer membrane lipoprotein-sorting protein